MSNLFCEVSVGKRDHQGLKVSTGRIQGGTQLWVEATFISVAVFYIILLFFIQHLCWSIFDQRERSCSMKKDF